MASRCRHVPGAVDNDIAVATMCEQRLLGGGSSKREAAASSSALMPGFSLCEKALWCQRRGYEFYGFTGLDDLLAREPGALMIAGRTLAGRRARGTGRERARARQHAPARWRHRCSSG